MLQRSRERMTPEERNRAVRGGFGRSLMRFFRALGFPRGKKHESDLVDVYMVGSERCFIYTHGELAVYFVDAGEAIVVLFGEWMFDPYVVNAPRGVLDTWNSEEEFFAEFTVRCAADTHDVVTLRVREDRFIRAEPVTAELRFRRLAECELVPGGAESLIMSLKSAGIVY